MVREVNIEKHFHFSKKDFFRNTHSLENEKTAEPISLQFLVITFSHVCQPANETSCTNWFKVIEGKEREM